MLLSFIWKNASNSQCLQYDILRQRMNGARVVLQIQGFSSVVCRLGDAEIPDRSKTRRIQILLPKSHLSWNPALSLMPIISVLIHKSLANFTKSTAVWLHFSMKLKLHFSFQITDLGRIIYNVTGQCVSIINVKVWVSPWNSNICILALNLVGIFRVFIRV